MKSNNYEQLRTNTNKYEQLRTITNKYERKQTPNVRERSPEQVTKEWDSI